MNNILCIKRLSFKLDLPVLKIGCDLLCMHAMHACTLRTKSTQEPSPTGGFALFKRSRERRSNPCLPCTVNCPGPVGRPNTVSLYVSCARTVGLTSLASGHSASPLCFAHRRDTTTGNIGVFQQAVRRPKAWTNTCIRESTEQMRSEVQPRPLSAPRRGTDLFSHGS